jgi:hypothetical protein
VKNKTNIKEGGEIKENGLEQKTRNISNDCSLNLAKTRKIEK